MQIIFKSWKSCKSQENRIQIILVDLQEKESPRWNVEFSTLKFLKFCFGFCVFFGPNLFIQDFFELHPLPRDCLFFVALLNCKICLRSFHFRQYRYVDLLRNKELQLEGSRKLWLRKAMFITDKEIYIFQRFYQLTSDFSSKDAIGWGKTLLDFTMLSLCSLSVYENILVVFQTLFLNVTLFSLLLSNYWISCFGEGDFVYFP